MTARLILTGRNDQLPRDAAQRTRLVVCPDCIGDGWVHEYPIDPSARPYRVPCQGCNGEGARER